MLGKFILSQKQALIKEARSTCLPPFDSGVVGWLLIFHLQSSLEKIVEQSSGFSFERSVLKLS